MGDVLSQNEIDNLLAALSTGELDVDEIKDNNEKKVKEYDFARPFTKESLLYRQLFEKYYPGQAAMVSGFWMPNRDWEGCRVSDPSARVLANYGASGV